jgi:hypothetical protein
MKISEEEANPSTFEEASSFFGYRSFLRLVKTKSGESKNGIGKTMIEWGRFCLAASTNKVDVILAGRLPLQWGR